MIVPAKNKYILGISDSRYDSGIALLSINKNWAPKAELVINEERLTRKKLQGGMPNLCLKKTLEKISADNISEIVFAGFTTPNIIHRLLNNGIQYKDYGRGMLKQLENIYSKKLGMVFIKPDSTAGKLISKLSLSLIRKNLPKGLKRKPIIIYDHHLCHAAGAYYTRYTRREYTKLDTKLEKEFKQAKQALIITADGMGDGYSLSVSIGRKNKIIKRIWSVDARDSLGEFYTFITMLLGFKPHNHEGKVTGLAAYGNSSNVKVRFPFSLNFPDCSNGNLPDLMPELSFNESWSLSLEKKYSALLKKYEKKDIAAWVQNNTEAIILRLVKFFVKKHNIRSVFLAGGLFSNVKLNQRIMELPEVKEVSVFPHMGDGGLALGAVLAHINSAKYSNEKQSGNSRQERQDNMRAIAMRAPEKEACLRIKNLFLGFDYSQDILPALKKSGLKFEKKKNIHSEIARILSHGRIVARYTGRSEYGPRALGNRTVLAPATDNKQKEKLNQMLKRTWFMPFAPVMLEEHTKKYLRNYGKADFSVKFMTISFSCTKELAKMCPAAVHIDNTVRPQVVIKEDDIDTYFILKGYYRLTGVPALINTSFNIHEEPIVETPYDAIRSVKESGISFLAIDDYLVYNTNMNTNTKTRNK